MFSGNTVIATVLSVVVITINTYLGISTMMQLKLGWFAILVAVIVGVLYLLFCVYLVIHMAINLGFTRLKRYSFVNKYIMGPVDGQLTNNPITYSR